MNNNEYREKSITVTELNEHIAGVIKSNNLLQNLIIIGEVSGFRGPHTSGHCYFTLKDEKSSVKVCMWRGSYSHLKVKPENGMSVIALGNIDVYAPRGEYTMIVSDMFPVGLGAQNEALEKLKQKLFEMGYFLPDRKRAVPRLPKRIGVVTSKTGAALQDIKSVLERRYPLAELLVFNALVQGAGADLSITSAIKSSEKHNLDVLIIGRGGGSGEDLSAFNCENVATAIYNYPAPVISAVGHEIDFSIADMVADLRAATPSAAAELASPFSIENLFEIIFSCNNALNAHIKRIVNDKNYQLLTQMHKLVQNSPQMRLEKSERFLDDLMIRAENVMKNRITYAEKILTEKYSFLTALNPLNVLSRGYGIVYKNGKAIGSVNDLKADDLIDVRLADGSVKAKVSG
jgi:exodeoxyribonuclease VII large subunit